MRRGCTLRRMSRALRIWLVWVGLVVSGCGCPKLFEAPPMPTGGPDAPTLLSQMRAHADRVQSLELVTRMDYFAEAGQARKGTVEVLARRPASVRFEVIDPAGANTMAILMSDGTRFASHERGQATCYVGDACASNIARLLPLPFKADELFDIFAGGAPLLAPSQSTASWDDCKGAWRVVQERQDGVIHRLWIRPDTGAAIESTMHRGETLLYRLTWDDYELADGVPVARKLHYEAPEGSVDLSMSIREAFLNSVDSDQPFVVGCPSGTTQRELQCR
ncbi:MAG: hypothetical protein ACI9WU_001199 [Myxococcota bacterium]|jgi:hypothetical protein